MKPNNQYVSANKFYKKGELLNIWRCNVCHNQKGPIKYHSGLGLCPKCFDDFEEIDRKTTNNPNVILNEIAKMDDRQKDIWNSAIAKCIEFLSKYTNDDGHNGTIQKEGVRRLHDLKIKYDKEES